MATFNVLELVFMCLKTCLVNSVFGFEVQLTKFYLISGFERMYLV